MVRKLIGILVVALGLASGYLFYKAGGRLKEEGAELTSLRSVGGNSIAESYYQSMGRYGVAYGSVCYAVGVGIVALSLGLGGRLFFADQETVPSQMRVLKPLAL
jgi:hypothetical protein